MKKRINFTLVVHKPDLSQAASSKGGGGNDGGGGGCKGGGGGGGSCGKCGSCKK
ncbi:MAG: hypothetical protein Q8Q05_02455 [bacterium]|nr:hypothetical protein [bacterium]